MQVRAAKQIAAMFTTTEQRSGSVGEAGRSWRRGRRASAAARAAGLAAVAAAALLAASPAGAQVPSGDAVFVHSAKSGKLSGGRLTLHGVRRHVTWAHHSGRSGVTPVKHMHRRLFSPGAPPATGTLHVAGRHGGDALTFKLSRPRHNHARRTVSYKVKRLGKGRLPGRRGGRAAGAAVRFGAASLSIVRAPQLTDGPQLGVMIRPTYPCDPPNPLAQTCFGAIYGRGFAAGSQFVLNVTLIDASGQNETFLTPTYYTAGEDGSLTKTNLNLPCNGTVWTFSITGPLGGPYDPPDECAWPP
jgi:hypothetical protein